jgi:hypothetical protein
MVVALGIASPLTLRLVDMEATARKAIEQSPQADQLSEEQMEQAIQMQVRVSKVLAPLSGLTMALLAVIVSGIFAVVLQLLEAGTTFRKLFSVVAHTWFLYSSASSLLTLVVIGLTPNRDQIDLRNPLYMNPGHLVDPKESPVLNSLLGSLDVLSFWQIGLLAVGLATVSSRLSRRRSTAAVVTVWLIYVLGKTGFTAIVTR